MNVGEMRARLRQSVALTWHLRYNFVPPIAPYWAEGAQLAINAIKEGDPARVINEKPAATIMDDLRLWEFVDMPPAANGSEGVNPEHNRAP